MKHFKLEATRPKHVIHVIYNPCNSLLKGSLVQSIKLTNPSIFAEGILNVVFVSVVPQAADEYLILISFVNKKKRFGYKGPFRPWQTGPGRMAKAGRSFFTFFFYLRSVFGHQIYCQPFLFQMKLTCIQYPTLCDLRAPLWVLISEKTSINCHTEKKI